MVKEKNLYRIRENTLLGGVSTGLSDYFSIDLVLIRVIFVATSFATFSAVFWLY
ncbi:MAG: PspC domain-containing protein [Candidatus Dojkabacteria bacterium]|nr:PspC domain-containing protein [Candidatus Dojkabacteria bacterium]MDQ7020839.1 PspC domain-containing protein [Candidatus Dojkabacteria bacterium]